MSRKGRRLFLISIALAVVASAAGLTLFALRGSVSLFMSPTEVVEGQLAPGARLRIGGLVKEGSVVRGDARTITFAVTDTNRDVPVIYTGVVPDLFREGQGVVAEGVLEAGGRIRADSVLAKHDENYMPREVAESLKKQGVWQGDGVAPATSTPPRL